MIWKSVINFEQYYRVSDAGLVWSNHSNEILSQSKDTAGRPNLTLCKNGRRYQKLVCQLVLEAFDGPRPQGLVCCHNDGNCTNNHVSNLRWDTQSSNVIDSIFHGKQWQVVKDRCPLGHVLDFPNLVRAAFNRNGSRNCLACGRGRASIRNAIRDRKQVPELVFIANEHYAKIMGGV